MKIQRCSKLRKIQNYAIVYVSNNIEKKLPLLFIGFTLRHVLSVFTHSAITPPKVNRFEWNLENSKYIVGANVIDFDRNPRVATAGEPGELCFFLSGKQRTISPISRRPNVTTFEHKTSIGVAIKIFESKFWKSYRKGSFF